MLRSDEMFSILFVHILLVKKNIKVNFLLFLVFIGLQGLLALRNVTVKFSQFW
jgi:hypothetical protein